jgi:DNA-binding NtrC family response regulator
VFTLGDTLRAVALREGQSLVVGRAEPAQIVFEDRSLSRTHARISLREGRVLLEDLGSTNGCTINGHARREAWLDESTIVTLGAVELRVTGPAPGPVQSAQWVALPQWMRSVESELARARLFGRSFAVFAVHTVEARARQSAAEAGPSRQSAAEAVSANDLERGRVDDSAREQSPRDLAPPSLPLRSVDLACRYGPSLSLVLLPEMRAQELASWADQVRRADAAPKALGAVLGPEAGASAEELIERALDAVQRARSGVGFELAESRRERRDLAAPVVVSPCMRRLYEVVSRAARTTLPVLVLGETGSGKELVAQAVHQRSPREKGPFKALNCATIPANLIESVLFGHERGAFTGADKQTQGLFEQAQGGTVFLDEVGELSEKAQAALLRVLEAKRIVRVGGTREIEVDVRIVAATHRDLTEMVKEGRFREDLMFRLDALSLRVPPLRERQEEIGPLARLFFERAREGWGAQVSGLSDDALEVLEAYRWPGNVRQLKNVIERAVAICAGNFIEVEDLPEQVLALPDPRVEPPTGAGSGFRSLPDRVREFEAGLIREALERAHGNQAQAARILGVPRRTLAHKAHVLGVVE